MLVRAAGWCLMVIFDHHEECWAVLDERRPCWCATPYACWWWYRVLRVTYGCFLMVIVDHHEECFWKKAVFPKDTRPLGSRQRWSFFQKQRAGAPHLMLVDGDRRSPSRVLTFTSAWWSLITIHADQGKRSYGGHIRWLWHPRSVSVA